MKEPESGNQNQSADPKRPPEKPKEGRLVRAFILGGATWLGVFSVSESILSPYGVPDVVAGTLGVVTGGFVSGMILEPDLRERQWRFLWLCIASPAILIWCMALLETVFGWDEDPLGLVLMLAFCIPAMAGSVLGYYASRAMGRRSGRQGDS